MSILLPPLVALGLAVAMMFAWDRVIRTGNSGWADAIWSASVGASGLAVTLIPLGPGEPTPRALLLAALVGIWSLRLATHIARRTAAGGDDPRYAALRRKWGEARYPGQLFLFLQIQAAAAFILAMAVMATAHSPAPFGGWDILGALIALGAIVGEALSDAQLREFRTDPANRDRVCDVGLWSVSRHPNYFFEFLFWVSLVPMALAPDYIFGWLAFAAPVLMYLLLAHVSGVPPLEEHMLRSRGDAYRRYQERVSAFWPLPAGRG